jgi:uncharacterized protein (DUF362 family)
MEFLMSYRVAVKKIDDPGGSPLDWTKNTINILVAELGNLIERTGFNLAKLKNSSVLIHPNLVRPHISRPASYTDPRIILAIAKLLRESGAKRIEVGENPGFGFSSRQAFQEAGLSVHLDRMNVGMLYFDELDWLDISNPNARLYNNVRISKHVLETDCLINVPKMKTHMLTQVSLCIKNMLGVIHDDQRMLFHRNDIADKVVDLNLLRTADLNIVDGLWPMEGQAPFHGDAIIGFNVLAAGINAAAVDAVCCRIMGFEPKEVPHVQLALKRMCERLNPKYSLEITGSPIDDLKRFFKRPVLSSMAQFDSVECIECGVCNGCLSAIRHSLDWLKAEAIGSALPHFTVVSGRAMPNMSTLKNWNGDLYLFGNCATEFQFYDSNSRNKAVWIPGCPPHVLDLAKLIRTKYLQK